MMDDSDKQTTTSQDKTERETDAGGEPSSRPHGAWKVSMRLDANSDTLAEDLDKASADRFDGAPDYVASKVPAIRAHVLAALKAHAAAELRRDPPKGGGGASEPRREMLVDVVIDGCEDKPTQVQIMGQRGTGKNAPTFAHATMVLEPSPAPAAAKPAAATGPDVVTRPALGVRPQTPARTLPKGAAIPAPAVPSTRRGVTRR